MLPPFNKIETRTWKTNYRGWVLICASAQPYKIDMLKLICGTQFERVMEASTKTTYPLGQAVALAKLVDCRWMTKADEERCYVQYFSHLYCHVYEEVQPVIPIPWKGKQGWTTVDRETILKLKPYYFKPTF